MLRTWLRARGRDCHHPTNDPHHTPRYQTSHRGHSNRKEVRSEAEALTGRVDIVACRQRWAAILPDRIETPLPFPKTLIGRLAGLFLDTLGDTHRGTIRARSAHPIHAAAILIDGCADFTKPTVFVDIAIRLVARAGLATVFITCVSCETVGLTENLGTGLRKTLTRGASKFIGGVASHTKARASDRSITLCGDT